MQKNLTIGLFLIVGLFFSTQNVQAQSTLLDVDGYAQILARLNFRTLQGNTSANITAFDGGAGDASVLDFYLTPSGNGGAQVRFFRNTNTTSPKQLVVLKGDGTSSANAVIGSDTDTYFARFSGNVGIGTATPQRKLHIYTDPSTPHIRMEDPFNHIDLWGGNNFSVQNTQGETLFFIDGFDTDKGNTGIGTASPAFLLEVDGSAGKPGGGSWSNSSDRRLKQNIEDFEDGLAQIMQIRPVWYQYNGKFGLPTEDRYVGVIAQEIQQVAPYTVTPYTETDEKTGETGEYLSYNGTAVTYMLVNAIQEQQAEIEALEARLAKIEAFLQGSATDYRPSTSTTTLSSARLEQNQPNPFDGSTMVRYFIPEGVKKAELRITNLQGKVIKSVAIQARGEGQITFDATTLGSGTYQYSLFVDGQLLDTKQMVLTR